jgi:hypothetical protein
MLNIYQIFNINRRNKYYAHIQNRPDGYKIVKNEIVKKN